MNLVKKIVLAILIAIVMIQFIQPAQNKSEQVLPTDLAAVYKMPDTVQAVLKAACYDCHSNNTNYPWYTYVQPVGWMLASHIQKGKGNLNFSEFGSYTARRQRSKLKAIANQVKDGDMPLYSYTIMHKEARLATEQKQLIIEWAQKTKDSLEHNTP